MKQFQTCFDIPDSFPHYKSKEEYKNICNEYIKCGAIPKKDLVIGAYYIGSCRNSNIAYWDGKEFHYWRVKFGDCIPDSVNHFEDDNGYDLFVPLKRINLL